MSLYRTKAAGEILRVKNTSEEPWDVVYASLTAPELVCLELFIDDVLVEVVYAGAGGSHSWWTQGGGKFIPQDYPNGLPPGSTLSAKVSGAAALRVDWYGEPRA